MAQSKMVSFEKLMIGGQHATWVSDKGTNWKFTVTFDNGDVGTAMSTKTNPSWKLGELYNYEKTVSGNYTNFKGMIQVDSYKPSKKGSYYDNPEEQKQLTFVWAIHNATEYVRMVEERMEKKLDRDKFEKLKIKFFMEAYSFPSPKIGRSFISAAIPLYKDEELKNIDAVIERARAFHREYVTISQDIKTPEREEAPTQNQSQPNHEPIPKQTDEELPF